MNLPALSEVRLKRVLILGAGGHDGPFLAEILQPKFEVLAHTRKPNQRLQKLGVKTLSQDLTEHQSISELIYKTKPDIVVNFLSLSSVYACQLNPELSYETNYLFVKKLTDVLKNYSESIGEKVILVQASSSEIFGTNIGFCNEETPLAPISKYGIDKARAHEFLGEIASQSLDIKRAILFNHESEYRNQNFVSQKIAIEAAKFRLGLSSNLILGNVNSSRDWGYAPDYMNALSLIINDEGDETFVVASGELHSLNELIRIAFNVGNKFDLSTIYTTDPSLIRSNETSPLVGSHRKLSDHYGWKPTINFKNMIEKMVNFQIGQMST